MESIRVLYVEDDASDRDLTRRHIERYASRLKLTTAATVAEGTDRIRAGEPAEVWHHDVGDHEVGPFTPDQIEGRVAVLDLSNDGYDIAGQLEDEAHRQAPPPRRAVAG